MQGGKEKGKKAKLEKTEQELKVKVVGKSQQTTLKSFEYENPTESGKKKNISGEWPPAYNPSVIEKNWYEWWEKSGFFTPDCQKNAGPESPHFTIIIPPPNVTGSLHIGHALTNAVQDALVRYYRQCGYRTEWLSGTDHAGISCQVVVEKQLAKEGLTRHDLGREKFLERAYAWKEQYGGKIALQLRRLGSSLDWSREVFTMDAQRTAAHNEAFKRLFEKKLIYRDNRLVGWDCSLQTAVSDIEIDPWEVKTPQQLLLNGKKYPFGYLWRFKYPLVPVALEGKSDSEIAEAFKNDRAQFIEFLEFGTTRPETMIGDSAVAVHPNDERYKQFHGRKVFTPVRNKTIPIVCDSICVDMNFGTGVVKITPAHDPNDFEVGKRHNLEFFDMLKQNGVCNSPENKRFDDMFRFDARIEMITFMTELGLYNGKEANEMAIKRSQRTGDIIEPVLRPQWYIDCKNMASRALKAMEDKELLIKPEIHEKIWRQYLSEIRPWCISRQLWWGHQIPLYKVWKKGEQEPDGSRTDDWVFALNDEEAVENGQKKLGCDKSEVEFMRDPDVTDTWFSSGLFPFSSFGWPENTADLQNFFPGSVLETGYDILFFWVARMVMLSLELHDKLPFREVYMHAMVRDSKGEKMSKSKGNVIDPLDCINGASLQKLNEDLKNTNLSTDEVTKAIQLQKAEFPVGIAQCGTDALRLALCVYTSQSRSINLDLNKIIAQRNFCNKIFNSVKFAFNFCGINQEFMDEISQNGFDGQKIHSVEDAMNYYNQNASKLGFVNRFILTKLVQLVYTYNKAMRTYDISTASEGCVTFFWDNLCDIYIEAVKPVLTEKVYGEGELYKITKFLLYTCIDQSLRMISIFMPFLCEEMFQHLPRWECEKQLDTIMFSKMPTDCKIFSFGNNEEWTNYDAILLDNTNIYTQIRNNKEISIAENEYELLKPLINTARNMKMQYNLNNKKIKFYVQSGTVVLSNEQLELFKTLTMAESVEMVDKTQIFDQCAATVINSDISVLADVKEHINVQAEIDKLDKEIKNIQQQIEKTQNLMNSDNFAKTPQKIKDQTQDKLEKLNEKLSICETLLDQYTKMRK